MAAIAVHPLVPTLSIVPSIAITEQFSAINDGAAVLYAQTLHSTDVCGPSGSPVEGCTSTVTISGSGVTESTRLFTAVLLQLNNNTVNKIIDIKFLIAIVY